MTSAKSPGRLLIIDGDTTLIHTARVHFERTGYQVVAATSGEAGLSLATSARPNLILLSLRLPDSDGLEVFRALRDKPRTGHIPVMILAGRDDALLQNTFLEEGAYDFIEKPLDLDILTLRVRNTLRRVEREGLTEPRTGLPTGRLIQERLRALEDERGWYRIDLKIDSFGTFRDLYGFVTANEALRFAGNLIAQVASECGSPNDFVGHPTGAEEFVIVTTLACGPALGEALAARVTQELQSFYNFMERDQGYVLVEDGAGGQMKKPLMAAQMHITQGEPDPNAPAQPPASSEDDVWIDANGSPPGDTSGSPFNW
jgi:PleD family two-component response regulator